MSLKVTVKLTADSATAAIRNLITKGEGRAEFNQNMALVMKEEWSDHLTEKYLPKDKDGVEFWRQTQDSMESFADDTKAWVSVNRIGAHLRYYGGEVKAGKGIAQSGPNKGKPTKALAIPTKSVPVSAGVRVRPVNAGLLAFIPAAKGRETVGYLVEGMERIAKRGKNKGKMIVVSKPGGALMYTLRTITRHKEDKGIIPDDKRLKTVMDQAARDYFED